MARGRACVNGQLLIQVDSQCSHAVVYTCTPVALNYGSVKLKVNRTHLTDYNKIWKLETGKPRCGFNMLLFGGPHFVRASKRRTT